MTVAPIGAVDERRRRGGIGGRTTRPRRFGWTLSGVVVLLVATPVLSGSGRPYPGSLPMGAQESPSSSTGSLPTCDTPAGSGSVDTNPIVENADVAVAFYQLSQALPQVRNQGSLASFTWE